MFRKLLTMHSEIFMPRETHWIPIMHDYFGLREAPREELIRIMEETYMAKGKSALLRIAKHVKTDYDRFLSEFRKSLPEKDNLTIREFMDCFYSYVAGTQGASICGDKTPDYAQCMPMLQSIWPEARFLHIYRDGRDVALSMSQVLSFRVQVAWQTNHWWSVAYRKTYERELKKAQGDLPIESFYELWRSRHLRAMDDRGRLKDGTYLGFRYEELLKDPHGVLGKVGGFLELPDTDAWVKQAQEMIRQDNVNKNADNPDYRLLTEKYSDDLASMGFTP